MATRPADDEGALTLDDPRWQGGRVRTKARAELFAWYFGALVLGGMLAPLVLRFEEVLAWNVFGAYGIVAIMTLLELHLAHGCVLHSLRWWRYGSLELALDPFPASPGGVLGGWIELPLEELEASDCRVTVRCVEVRISRTTSNSKSSWESVVWSSEHVPELRGSGPGTRLGFRFELPAEAPPSQPWSNHHFTWSVRVEARVPGLDLDRVFEVPVLPDAASQAARDPARSHPPVDSQGEQDLPQGGGVRVSPSVDGVRLDYPPLRGIKGGLTALVFGSFFLSIGLGYSLHMWRRSDMSDLLGLLFSAPFVLAFGGFGLLIIGCGLWMALNGLEVQLSPNELRARRRFLLWGQARSVAVSDVERVVLRIGSQLGQGARALLTYRMRAELRDGGSFTLGDGIQGTPTAQALAELVTGVTGLPTEVGAPKRLRATPAGESETRRAA